MKIYNSSLELVTIYDHRMSDDSETNKINLDYTNRIG